MKSIIFVVLLFCVGLYFYSVKFFATILAIAFLIFFHELGHFLVAKFFKVGVNVFSVGFGEKIYKKKIADTTYCISAIPLGGYVQLKGQNDADPSMRSDDPDSYNKTSPFKRILILFAGPFFNLILAFLIYVFLGFYGVERIAPVVGKIASNSAASEILLENDKILAINGVKVREWDDISAQISPNPMQIRVLRDNKELNFTLTPKIGKSKSIFGEDIQKPLIGIGPKNEYVIIKNPGLSSLKYAWDESVKASTLILVGLEKLVTGVVSPKEMGGIVAITDITSRAAGYGLGTFLVLVALISINLGLINLFPIPALDGGHIVFNLYELIMHREVPEKLYIWLNYFGMAVLFTLMAFTILNDFLRIFGFYK